MAIEYRFHGSAEVTTEEIVSFMAQAVDGSVAQEGLVQCEGLTVNAHRVAPGEEVSAAQLFGFTHRVTATFRFSNNSSSDVRERNTALMIRAVLLFFERYPGDGVLLFNGEEVVLQRLAGELALNSDWEDWGEPDVSTPWASRREFRPLPQPLL